MLKRRHARRTTEAPVGAIALEAGIAKLLGSAVLSDQFAQSHSADIGGSICLAKPAPLGRGFLTGRFRDVTLSDAERQEIDRALAALPVAGERYTEEGMKGVDT